MPQLYTVTTAAAAIGVNKSTVSRHLAKSELGARTGGVIVLTESEVKKLRRMVEKAKSGNPGPRKKDGTFRKR